MWTLCSELYGHLLEADTHPVQFQEMEQQLLSLHATEFDAPWRREDVEDFPCDMSNTRQYIRLTEWIYEIIPDVSQNIRNTLRTEICRSPFWKDLSKLQTGEELNKGFLTQSWKDLKGIDGLNDADTKRLHDVLCLLLPCLVIKWVGDSLSPN